MVILGGYMTYQGFIKKSRTLDFNVLIGLLAAAEQNLPILRDVLPATVYPILFFVVLMANVGLRFVSNGPVGVK